MKIVEVKNNETFKPSEMGGNGIGGNGFSSISTDFSLSQEEFEKLIKELI